MALHEDDRSAAVQEKLTEATSERNIMLNSVRQHNCFITQGSYIGYMFPLLISHLQAYSSQLSHKTLCTHWDPSVFTSVEYIKLDHFLRKL